MDVSLMIEGQMGLDWPRWRAVVDLAERAGFHGLYRSDHFVSPNRRRESSLEMVTSLTFAATMTTRILLGPLVAPVSFRDPIMFARQGAALHDLSEGRFVFGVGAGWMTQEHEMFGYELLDVPGRMDRLEEALEVTTRLLRSDEPVSFEGRFYRVRDAWLSPRPSPAPPVLVGGGGVRRTLPLVARYADVWNATGLTPHLLRERSEILDGLLRDNGRAPDDVKRTLMVSVWTGADGAALERRLAHFGEHPILGGKPVSEVVAALRSNGSLAGTFDEVREQRDALAAAGVQEIMVQWFWLDDMDGLAAAAEMLLH